MTKKVNWQDKNIIEEICKISFCYSDVLRNLKLCTKGSNSKTLKKWINKHNIDISHFDPYKGLMKKLSDNNRIPLSEILDGQHPNYNTTRLKNRILKSGIKKNICEKCGIGDVWNNQPLILQLDHINGDNNDHNILNLMLICPNCHTQTITWGRKKQTMACRC